MKAVTGEGIAVTGRRCYYYSRHFIDDSQPIISSICQGGPLLLEKQETPANPYVQVRFGQTGKQPTGPSAAPILQKYLDFLSRQPTDRTLSNQSYQTLTGRSPLASTKLTKASYPYFAQSYSLFYYTPQTQKKSANFIVGKLFTPDLTNHQAQQGQTDVASTHI